MYDDRLNATRGYFYTDPERGAIESYAAHFGAKPPVNFEVCPDCEGRGARALGGAVLSDESLDDRDFMDDYMSGRYDKRCETCKGERVVEVVNEDRLTKEQRSYLAQTRREIRSSNAESLAEFWVGA